MIRLLTCIIMMDILPAKGIKSRLIMRMSLSSPLQVTLRMMPSPVWFCSHGKAKGFTKPLMWKAIMDRREVAVLGSGKMMGPELYRNSLELLLLDRVFLEEYFGDRITLEASTKGYELSVNVTNTYEHAVSGTIEIVLPPELKMTGTTTTQVKLPPDSIKRSYLS